jgi:hypothetical protein
MDGVQNSRALVLIAKPGIHCELAKLGQSLVSFLRFFVLL